MLIKTLSITLSIPDNISSEATDNASIELDDIEMSIIQDLYDAIEQNLGPNTRLININISEA